MISEDYLNPFGTRFVFYILNSIQNLKFGFKRVKSRYERVHWNRVRTLFTREFGVAPMYTETYHRGGGGFPALELTPILTIEGEAGIQKITPSNLGKETA